YAYNAGGFVERVDGGPEGEALVANFDYHPSSEVARAEHGNGVVSIFTHDDRHRLSTQVTRGSGGEILIDSELVYDPASNVIRRIDRRSFESVERASPRRNTQSFAYDELHRLVRARYEHADVPGSNLGQIDYAYDAIGNLVARTTPPAGSPGHIGRDGIDLGAIAYAGGREGRIGRLPGDPPGPHAATGSASGRTLAYDANGNVTRLDDAVLAWDAKDQLIAFERPGVTAMYLYDYSDRRVAKKVAVGDVIDETIYADPYFEERPGVTPVKHVLSGDMRIASVTGTIDPTRDRIQRLRLREDWNAITLSVDSGQTLAQLFGDDAA